jgi:CRISPR/Cas system-associated protein Cas10 (large subunit of type III CRISPR-Cas system)
MTINDQQKLDIKNETLKKMANVARHSLEQLLEQAAEYNQKIKTAKTSYKKQYYQKKLSKMSTTAMEHIMFLQSIEKLSLDNQVEQQEVQQNDH